MKHFLIIADRLGVEQRIVGRAVELASRVRARLTIVGFVYEHVGNLAEALSPSNRVRIKETLIERHRTGILRALAAVPVERTITVAVDVF